MDTSRKQSTSGEKNQNIKVYVRCRPINEQERKARSQLCVDVQEPRKSIIVKSHHEKTFTFDGTFGKDSTQIDVYKSVVQPLIGEVLQGYNCTVFAYGQTGTGKTYTMEGIRSEALLSWQHDPHAGVVPRALHQIFSEVGDPELTIIKVSFLELYNEELFDLLGSGEAQSSKLKIFEDSTAKGSVVVRGLEEVVVRDRQEVYALMERGASRRQVAATLMNASSSRSHTIFTITVISRDTTDTGEGLMRTGKLNLVDLAGSENIGRSGAQDKRAREAGNINQSLLTLGRVITALVERAPHVPYRESKLTRLLQDSLGGRTKTSIVATISPAHVNLEETLSTLEYAFRAKNITNRPQVNQKLCKEVVLKHMTDELEQLRRDLIACREKNGFYIDETNYRSMQSRLDLQSEELQKKAEEMTTMAERIELLKTQIDDINGIFEVTQKQLETESRSKEIAQSRLKEVNLNYTAAKVVIKAQQQTEEKLHQDASQLIKTAVMAKTDVRKLHEKVERQHDVEAHNSEVIDKFSAVLTSSLDSTSRRMEDAAEILLKSCSLKDETIKCLQEEGRLIQEVDCLLGAITRNHLTSKQRFLEKLSAMNELASDSLMRLTHARSQLEDTTESTLSKVSHYLCSDLKYQLDNMRNSLGCELAEVLELFGTEREAALQLCGRVQKNEEFTRNLAKRMASEKAEIMRVELAKVRVMSDTLKQLSEEILTVFVPRCEEPDYSQMMTVENDLVCGAVDEFLARNAQISDRITSKFQYIEKQLATSVEQQQETTRGCVENIETDLRRCKEQMSKHIQDTNENLNELLRNREKTRIALKKESGLETSNLALLSANVYSAAAIISESKGKLLTLKEAATEMFRANVKTCEVTGSTPARRSYEIPHSLVRTQPVDILQKKMQKKLDEATIEERTALDEGHSMLFDVTASPEVLDFGSEEDKENSFDGVSC